MTADFEVSIEGGPTQVHEKVIKAALEKYVCEGEERHLTGKPAWRTFGEELDLRSIPGAPESDPIERNRSWS